MTQTTGVLDFTFDLMITLLKNVLSEKLPKIIWYFFFLKTKVNSRSKTNLFYPLCIWSTLNFSFYPTSEPQEVSSAFQFYLQRLMFSVKRKKINDYFIFCSPLTIIIWCRDNICSCSCIYLWQCLR